jgi:hypothetical protein
MLLPPKRHDLFRGIPPDVPRCQVIQLRDLPPVGIRDASPCPCQSIGIPVEFHHRLSHLDELVRPRLITTKKLDDPLDIAIKHGQAFVDISQRKDGLPRFTAAAHFLALRGESRLPQRAGVALRVEDEEVLIVDRETDHPTSQLYGIGDTGVASHAVKLE